MVPLANPRLDQGVLYSHAIAKIPGQSSQDASDKNHRFMRLMVNHYHDDKTDFDLKVKDHPRKKGWWLAEAFAVNPDGR